MNIVIGYCLFKIYNYVSKRRKEINISSIEDEEVKQEYNINLQVEKQKKYRLYTIAIDDIIFAGHTNNDYIYIEYLYNGPSNENYNIREAIYVLNHDLNIGHYSSILKGNLFTFLNSDKYNIGYLNHVNMNGFNKLIAECGEIFKLYDADVKKYKTYINMLLFTDRATIDNFNNHGLLYLDFNLIKSCAWISTVSINILGNIILLKLINKKKKFLLPIELFDYIYEYIL